MLDRFALLLVDHLMLNLVLVAWWHGGMVVWSPVFLAGFRVWLSSERISNLLVVHVEVVLEP